MILITDSHGDITKMPSYPGNRGYNMKEDAMFQNAALHQSVPLGTPSAAGMAFLTAYHHAAVELLNRERIDVQICDGGDRWREVMLAAQGTTIINPTFDKDRSEVTPDNTFSALLSRAGDTIACMACRLFKTDDYYGLVRSGELWQAGGYSQALPVIADGESPSGKIGHTGGLWVHIDARGTGLSWILPRIVAATTVATWWTDWHVGTIFHDLNRTGIPNQNYGSSTNKPLLNGYFPPTGRSELIHSVETSRADIIERSRADLSEILRDTDKKVRDLAPIAKKRNNSR
jgi:hypothetical protein